MAKITKVKVVEEEDKTLEAGGEVEIKTQVLAEKRIMHLMLNGGARSYECPTQRRPNNRGRGRRQQNNYAETNRNNGDDRSK